MKMRVLKRGDCFEGSGLERNDLRMKGVWKKFYFYGGIQYRSSLGV